MVGGWEDNNPGGGNAGAVGWGGSVFVCGGNPGGSDNPGGAFVISEMSYFCAKDTSSPGGRFEALLLVTDEDFRCGFCFRAESAFKNSCSSDPVAEKFCSDKLQAS